MFDRSKPELTEQAACEILHKTVIWNNKLSLFGLKAESVFYESLFKEGIISLRELAIKQGGLVIMGQILARTDLTECFCKISIIHVLPVSWRHHLKTFNNYEEKNSTFSERTC